MKAKNLSYNVAKYFVENGVTYKMNVRISLGDYDKNGICDWSITADIYEKRRNGRFVWCASNCCHDEILKYFPEFKPFVNLHLSNHYGQPMYPVENGFYHLKNSDKEKTINYLRITETEYNTLRDSAEDKAYFTYLLYTLGIVDRWEQESLKAIKQLEALTGNTWENPYKPENERFVLRLTDEERTLIENRIKDGYYTSEAIQAREDQKKREEYEKKRNEIIADCEKEIQKAENRKLIRLAILNAGIPLKNVIYYNHSNELVFNWNDCEAKVTKNQFDEFIKTVDKTKLPENITFKLK
jgi:hypothetical protein